MKVSELMAALEPQVNHPRRVLFQRLNVVLCCVLAVLVVACEGTGVVQNNTKNNIPAQDMSLDSQGDQGPTDSPPDLVVDMRRVDMVRDGMMSDDMGEDLSGDLSAEMSMLPCDEGFWFEPAIPQTGGIITVHFTHPTGWTYIGFDIRGPGQIKGNKTEHVSKSDPPHWFSKFTASAGGLYTMTFYGEQVRRDIATCQVAIADTGPPPPIDDPPTASCQGKVCGDDDGAGGTCTSCPMVGTCLDPASPIGPNGPGQTWACLDNAGCNEGAGKCVIWCPGEPCLYEDSGGCPQGVESCLVDPGQYKTYEEACASCCRSRFHNRPGSPGHNKFACWDDAYNICRYPGDCGKPYPQP